jgi:hypothetical protein
LIFSLKAFPKMFFWMDSFSLKMFLITLFFTIKTFRKLLFLFLIPRLVSSTCIDPKLWKMLIFNFSVALNYQTEDKENFINSARFSDNGGCGFVLKPEYMRDQSIRLVKLKFKFEKLILKHFWKLFLTLVCEK